MFKIVRMAIGNLLDRIGDQGSHLLEWKYALIVFLCKAHLFQTNIIAVSKFFHKVFPIYLSCTDESKIKFYICEKMGGEGNARPCRTTKMLETVGASMFCMNEENDIH